MAVFLTDIKQGTGAEVFPTYALNEEVTGKIWSICRELSKTEAGLIGSIDT